ncbi:UNVERIFIED_CONTAM: hypothetical protein K2H54_068027 [Gekko kuhli]
MSGRSPHGKRRAIWGGNVESMWKPCVWQVCVNLTKAGEATRLWPKPNGKGEIWKSRRETGLQRVVRYQRLKEVPHLRQRKHLAFHNSDYSNIHFQGNLLRLPDA